MKKYQLKKLTKIKKNTIQRTRINFNRRKSKKNEIVKIKIKKWSQTKQIAVEIIKIKFERKKIEGGGIKFFYIYFIDYSK
jgi:hypothetical protein